MGYQLVLVNAWVPERGEAPEPPLGIWGPTDPRPGWGLPEQPPGIWGGGNVPMPTPPIYFPPSGGGGQPGVPTHPIYNPPGIWGPNDPRPSQPIYFPDRPGSGGGQPGVPTHPIYNPPGIWGPTDPRPSQPIYFPEPPLGIWGGGNVPFPEHPIAPGGPPPQVSHPIYRPDLKPEHPIYNPPPSFPILDPDSLPDHPEVPDMNFGTWVYVQQGGLLVQAFVPTPQIHITNPIYNPSFPPEEYQPGEWVSIYYVDANFNGLTWAWIPSVPAEEPPVAAQLPS
jgi:hypothetical protein